MFPMKSESKVLLKGVDDDDDDNTKVSWITNLPDSILLEIFLELPFHALLRNCKYVCKDWYRLIITDPDFVKLISRKYLFVSHRYFKDFLVFKLERDGSDYYQHPPVLNKPEVIKNVLADLGYSGLVGSCNGLILFNGSSTIGIGSMMMELLRGNFKGKLTYYAHFKLCNPLLWEFCSLPTFEHYAHHWDLFVGFGYGLRTGHYKVVVHMKTNSLGEGITWILTVGLNSSWRSCKNDPLFPCKTFPSEVHSKQQGIYANGYIHWLAGKCNKEFMEVQPRPEVEQEWERETYVFDVELEEFHELSLPQPIAFCEPNEKYLMLSILGGRLCSVVNRDDFQRNVEIWLMERYGDAKSWTKKWTFREGIFHYLLPLEVWRDDEILVSLTMGDSFFSYQTKEKRFVRVAAPRKLYSFEYHSDLYVPNFSSFHKNFKGLLGLGKLVIE